MEPESIGGRDRRFAAVLEELRALDRQLSAAADLVELKPIFYRIDAIAKENPGSAEVLTLAAEVKGRLLTRGAALREAGQPASVPSAESSPAADAARTALPGKPVQPEAAAAPPDPAAARPPARLAQSPAPAARSKKPLIVGAAAGTILFAIGVFLTQDRGKSGPEPPALTRLEIRTSPPGATLFANGQTVGNAGQGILLPEGTHELEARLDGYMPGFAKLTVATGTPPAPLELTLLPRPQAVRFLTDLQTGKVTLNGQPAGSLQEGQLVLDNLPAGRHTVKVAGGNAEASFSFQIVPGKAPLLEGAIAARNLLAVVMSNSGGEARIYSSSIPLKIGMDGRGAEAVEAAGLVLKDVPPGSHELTLGEGADQKKIVAAFGPAPTLTAFLKLDLNAGTLVIVTREDEATVTIDGKPYRRKTKGGQVRIPFLAVRNYQVSVAKDGYEKVPAVAASIRKGEETKLEFVLKPIPRLAALRIRGAQPGTSVLVDGAGIGTVRADGTFSTANIEPGDRTIELRLDKHLPRQARKQFVSGAAVELSGADAALETATGTLKLLLSPAESSVAVRRSEESQARPSGENPLQLTEGSYVIAASAPGHVSRSITVQVVAGETKSVDLQLAREKDKAAPAPAKLGMSAWEKAPEWRTEGSWRVHKGGEFVLYSRTPVHGSFVFTAALLKGRRLQWFVNYLDSKNHALFQADKRFFYRKNVVAGKTTELAKVPHGLLDADHFTLQVHVSPAGVVHQIFRKDTWSPLDSWSQPGRNFSAGKFGLLIPGGDEVGLLNFSFTPK